MKKNVPILIIIFSLLISLVNIQPVKAVGAFLFFSPSTGTKVIESVFPVTVKLNSGGQTINASEGSIIFDSNKLEVTGISKNGSIFNMWTAEPSFNNNSGVISFGGGVPQPGYSGKSGTIVTISFRAKVVGEASMFFSSGAILANDGLGSNILTSMGSANFNISPKSETPAGDDSSNKTNIGTSSTGQKIVNQASLANELNIFSPSHPKADYWYSSNNVELKWAVPEGASQIGYAFNNDPGFDPGEVKAAITDSQKYENVKDGIWYFHLKFKVNNKWTNASHYKIQIDSTPPRSFKINVEQKHSQDLPVLFFDASDETSGIVRYEINIGSLEEKAFVVDPAEKMLKVPSLEVGPHTAMVKAIDSAGNEVISIVEFTITPIETPTIKNYSQEVKPSDRFFISGTALSDVEINVYLQKLDGKVVTKKTSADKNGRWYIVGDASLDNGQYLAWVEAINNNGLKSEPSPKISFLVTPPVFTRIGNYVVNYFTVLVSLLFMIILVVISVIYLSYLIRRKLKKETIEVEEVLHDNLNELKSYFDKEISRIARHHSVDSISQEKPKIKQNFRQKIDLTERKIMKEIKDVEKLLK